ncbi:MAG: hypothetical protein KDM63_04950 [Verrucomicrobiae bacterium]|nr:hypothetical protein [Verrucomicrobiae bacterium]
MESSIRKAWHQYLGASLIACFAKGVAIYLEVSYPDASHQFEIAFWVSLLIAAVVLFAIVAEATLIHRMWSRIPFWYRRFAPLTAALGMVAPFLNLVWCFVLFPALARNLDRWERELAAAQLRPPQRMDGVLGLALTAATLFSLNGIFEILIGAKLLSSTLWNIVTFCLITAINASYYFVCVVRFERLLDSTMTESAISTGGLPAPHPARELCPPESHHPTLPHG